MKQIQLFALVAATAILAGSPARAQVCVNAVAGANPVEFGVPGDLKIDGNINVADAMCGQLLVLWSVGGEVGAPPSCLTAPIESADLNCDSEFTVGDVMLIVGLALNGQYPSAVDADGDGCADECTNCPDSLTNACTITGDCLLEGELHPTIECQVCEADPSGATFVAPIDGTVCGTGLICISGSCEPSPPPMGTGSFGSDLDIPPSSLQTSDAIVLDGFFGTVPLVVNGPATVEVDSGSGFAPATVASPGDSVRLLITSGSGFNAELSATLSAGDYTSAPYVVRTYFYTTGQTTSFGSCSGPCSSSNGTQSTATWNCNRSDGTTGHSQSFCSSPNQSQSCTTSSCFNSNPPSVSGTGGTSPTVSFGPTTFNVECSADGAQLNALQNFVINTSGQSVEFGLLTSSTGRVGAARINFTSSSNGLVVSSMTAGTAANSFKSSMCHQPSAGECQSVFVPSAGVSTFNCSSPISCRIQRNDTGQLWWFVRGSSRSQSYMTSSAFRSQRENDNFCISSAEFAAARADSGLNGIPCYIWQPGCPFN